MDAIYLSIVIAAYNAEKYSDLYLIELTHFLYPSWTYEKCEDYVFNQN